MRIIILAFFTCFFTCLSGQQRIIDMHVHSILDKEWKEPVKDFWGINSSANDSLHFIETYAMFKKLNIVKAVVCGSLKSVAKWKAQDAGNRIIRGFEQEAFTDDDMDSVKFLSLVQQGKIEIYGEVGPYFSGTTLSDAVWQPYLRICEKYDIPVAVHTGGGGPGETYTTAPKARLLLGDPYLVEDVLVRYPKLRIYLMHSGEQWHEHALRMMAYYPNLYTDVAVLLWVSPMAQRYATEFLKNAKQAGCLDRVMFGSDQFMWPSAIQRSVDFLNSLDFLSKEDKEGIFYNNAARFLRLK